MLISNLFSLYCVLIMDNGLTLKALKQCCPLLVVSADLNDRNIRKHSTKQHTILGFIKEEIPLFSLKFLI